MRFPRTCRLRQQYTAADDFENIANPLKFKKCRRPGRKDARVHSLHDRRWPAVYSRVGATLSCLGGCVNRRCPCIESRRISNLFILSYRNVTICIVLMCWAPILILQSLRGLQFRSSVYIREPVKDRLSVTTPN